MICEGRLCGPHNIIENYRNGETKKIHDFLLYNYTNAFASSDKEFGLYFEMKKKRQDLIMIAILFYSQRKLSLS